MKKLATSESTLRQQVGKSLEERCVLLHRAKPEIKIKRTTLAAIYKEHGVRKKVVVKKKVVPDKSKKFVEEAIVESGVPECQPRSEVPPSSQHC